MKSGLFGCCGLPGGTSTKNWGNEVNFNVRSISPVAPSHKHILRRQVNIRDETGLRPEDIRRLVQALSIPEIMHIIKKWHIQHPSGRPIGDKLNKHALADLVAEHDGALGDAIRITTARPGAGAGATLRICGARSASPGYSSLLRELSAWPAPGSPIPAPPTVDLLAAPPRAPPSPQPSPPPPQHRRLRVTGLAAEQRGMVQRLVSLRAELGRERAAREDCALQLAARGLLSVALDGDMARPIARTRDRRVETVLRCGAAVGALRGPVGVNPHLAGVLVDDALRHRAGAGAAAYGSSALHLCP